jgi:hypothetical protein
MTCFAFEKGDSTVKYRNDYSCGAADVLSVIEAGWCDYLCFFEVDRSTPLLKNSTAVRFAEMMGRPKKREKSTVRPARLINRRGFTHSQTSPLDKPEGLQPDHNNGQFLFIYCSVALCSIQAH